MHTVTELIITVLAGDPLTRAERREIARQLLRLAPLERPAATAPPPAVESRLPAHP